MNYNGISRKDLKSAGNNLTYLLIGGGIGATLALLFAPKSGVELRQDISEGAKYGLETANEKVTQFREVAGEKVTHLREVAGEKVSGLKDTASTYYNTVTDKVGELYGVATKSASDGTAEAKDLASRAANGAKELAGIGEGEEPQNVTKEVPHFDSGDKRPTEQRTAKANVL